ncbi:MAG: galactose mutarotase [Spirochaetia bacterium]|nr:galactose mutarotase [Spirochaetia bacterium]
MIITHPKINSNKYSTISLYTLKAGEISVTISTLGATIISIVTPDKNHQLGNIVLGYEDIHSYEIGECYFGSTIGRYADRIRNGEFKIEGEVYSLNINDPKGHSVHGGRDGFSNQNWTVQKIEDSGNPSISLSLTCLDKEMGYPGNLEVIVTYTLNAMGDLIIDYDASVDKRCPLSFTNHTYFNLSQCEKIFDHHIKLNCSAYLPTDEMQLPTGEISSVYSTPFDLTHIIPIGQKIQSTGGFDHAYIIDREEKENSSLILCAQVQEPMSGRTLDVFTTYPVILFYTGNDLHKNNKGKPGASQTQYGGFCMEAQNYPNSMNEPNFPSYIISPGQRFFHTIVYSFGTYG